MALRLLGLLNFVLVSFVVSQEQAYCPQGWTFANGTSNCFYLTDWSYTRDDGINFCANIGGVLASINYLADRNFLANMTMGLIVPPFIGLYYNTSMNKWQNLDGTSYYSGWISGQGEPNLNNGNCAIFKSKGTTTSLQGMATAPCYNSQPILCKQPGAVCNGGNFGGPSAQGGNFTSPNYPNYYYNNLDCFYYITSPNGTYITIVFDPLLIQWSLDTISVYEGTTNATSALIGKITSSTSTRSYESMGNQMLVWFHTSTLTVDHGWMAAWKTKRRSDPVIQSGSSGQIASPNYPANYDNFLEQFYYITASDQFKVQVNIGDFKTQLNHDYLFLYNSLNQTDDTLVANLSGTVNVAPWQYTFPSNVFSMKFISDATIQYSGWNLTWTIV